MSVSSPLPHDAAPLHVTGQARYVDDMPMTADTLHLAFGLSGIAAGRITVDVNRTYPLAEAARAHTDLESGALVGSNILIP